MLYKTGEGAPVVTQKEETEQSAEDDDDDVLDMDDFEAQGLTLEVEDSVSDLKHTVMKNTNSVLKPSYQHVFFFVFYTICSPFIFLEWLQLKFILSKDCNIQERWEFFKWVAGNEGGHFIKVLHVFSTH